MRFLVRLKPPQKGKDSKYAWVEPNSDEARKKLKKSTGQEFLKIETHPQGNLLVGVVEALFKLFSIFSDSNSEIKMLKEDFMDIANAYTHHVIIDEWSNSPDKGKREIAKKINEEAYRRNKEILSKVGKLKKWGDA